MAEKEAKDLGLDFKSLGDAVNKFKQPLESLKQEVKVSVDTFNALSSTGNAFNNDIIGMKVAAANSRMSLDDLSQMLQKNNGEVGKTFAGLGGSVTKGSQVFTDFSKTFFDSGLTENLRQMGYTSKDLNEVLASQIGFQKSTTDTSVQGQIRTAAAAASLAEEMDLIAKLTGKSRKEQEEQLNKAKMDGQIEAKFRLIGIQQGADAEKSARENFAKQLAQSQAMGTDAVFKEMFATGTVRSREASMQMGLLGGAARETANSAKALAKGNAEASQAAMNSAKVFNIENQKNVALLQVAAAGVGEAGAVMKKSIETNDAAFHGLMKTQKAAEAIGKSFENTAAAMNAQREAIKQEQQARHGVTSATIATTSRMQDLNAAIANQVVKPLNEGNISKSALKFADSINQGVKATDSVNKTAEEYQKALVNQAKIGDSAKGVGARESLEKGVVAPIAGPIVKGADVLIGGGMEKLMSGAASAKQFYTDVMEVKNFKANIPSRDAGTLGKTGVPFEPTDLIAKIHKGEMVLTPDQAKKFMEGAKSDGAMSAISDMSKTMSKIELPKESLTKEQPVSKIEMPKELTNMISDMSKTVPKIEIPKESLTKEQAAPKMEIPKELSNAISDMHKSMPKMEIPKELSDAISDRHGSAPKMEIPKELSNAITDLHKSMPNIDVSKVPGKIDVSSMVSEVKKIAPKESKSIEKPATDTATKMSRDFKMPTMDQISFGPDGMPRISARPQAAAMAQAVAAEKKQQQTPRTAETVETKTAPTKSPETATTVVGSTAKESTLNDVVKSLDSLNMFMGKLLNQSETTTNLIERQVKATKAIGGNVYDRMS
jgi:hypothetical protein